MNELEFGKTYYPRKSKLSISENLVQGQGWQAQRLADKIVFEFIAARHGGGVDSYDITEFEFSALKCGDLSAEDLIRKYDRS